MRVPQRRDGFVVVVGGGTDVRDHDRLAVSTQRVLEYSCQLWVSENLLFTYVDNKKQMRVIKWFLSSRLPLGCKSWVGGLNNAHLMDNISSTFFY